MCFLYQILEFSRQLILIELWKLIGDVLNCPYYMTIKRIFSWSSSKFLKIILSVFIKYLLFVIRYYKIFKFIFVFLLFKICLGYCCRYRSLNYRCNFLHRLRLLTLLLYYFKILFLVFGCCSFLLLNLCWLYIFNLLSKSFHLSLIPLLCLSIYSFQLVYNLITFN
jgi:hypothetical protein